MSNLNNILWESMDIILMKIPLYIEEFIVDDSCCFRNIHLQKRVIGKVEFVELIEDFATVQSFVPLLSVRVMCEKWNNND